MTSSNPQPTQEFGGDFAMFESSSAPRDWNLVVISDTHVGDRVPNFNPQLLAAITSSQPDAILHAGDVSKPAVLAELTQIAPVFAVQGNRDWLNGFNLPKKLEFTVNGIAIVLTHGHINMWEYMLNYLRLFLTGRKLDVKHFPLRLAKLYPDADLIIFGHTHFQVDICEKGQRFFNPGAAYAHFLNHNQIQYGLLRITAAGEIKIEKMTLSTDSHTGSAL